VASAFINNGNDNKNQGVLAAFKRIAGIRSDIAAG
jgi:hypothetical protein